MQKEKSIRWNIPVPKLLDQALEEAVKLGTYSTKSDFIREAVREKLAEMGFRPQIFVSDDSAKGT